jgi:serine/threonine-protein kinase
MQVIKSLPKLLWLAPFASFIAGYLLIGLLYQNKVIPTPALVGLPLDKALIILSKANLNIRIIDHKDETDLEQGTILSQKPAPGTLIRQNQSLYVVIAQKPAPIQAPDIRNKKLPEATKLIESSSLQAKTYPMATQAPHNVCIAQYPQAGTVPDDKTVIIYYAQQNIKPVIMPNLKTKSVEDVSSFLMLHDLQATILHSAPVEPGHQCNRCIIIDQRPLPGSLITLTPDKPLQIQLQVN